MVTDRLTTLIREAVLAACQAGELQLDGPLPAVVLEPPRRKQFGDYACNLPMLLARSTGLPAPDVAARILKWIPAPSGLVERAEIAGPGFLNFHLRPDWLHDVMVEIETKDEAYGSNRAHAGDKALIEFVSANPTGPISVVNGRAAALGDTLRRLLQACGAEVSTEFYVNDALNSTQMELLGESLACRYLQELGRPVEMPENGYQGDYVIEMAREIVSQVGDSLSGLAVGERSLEFRRLATEQMINQQRSALAAFGVEFDRWFFESSLYDTGAVRKAITDMKARGYAYEKDGALWLKTTVLSGDDQDRVLVRSNEKETYVAADAAYHRDKFDRGFNRLINIWGADHHGYVSRLKAGIAALGCPAEQCEVLLTQMVMLMRDGEPVRGSKRAGDIIPLVDLVNEVGRAAGRFYFLMNSYETTAAFDLELAKRQSSENPVFYAQYAHARCCSVLQRAEDEGVAAPLASEAARSLLTHEKELDLLRKLADYPGEVRMAADLLAPHRLAGFVREIGQALHQFYEECPALKVGVSDELRGARLALFQSTATVVRNLLALLGIEAPTKMERSSGPAAADGDDASA